MNKQESIADIIAAINTLRVAQGKTVIKSVHTRAKALAQLEALRAVAHAAAPVAPVPVQQAKADATLAIAKASVTSAVQVRAARLPKKLDKPARAAPAFPERLASEAKGTKGISEASLRAACPAVFATSPSSKVSDRYRFVSTWDLIKPLIEEGYVVTAMQQKRPQAGREFSMQHTRHLLRLRPSDAPLLLGEAFPEIVVVNGHAGQAKLEMYTGLMRLICLNGLVTGSITDQLRTKHTGSIGGILDEAQRVIKSAQEKARVVEAWMNLKLTKSIAFDFARAAALLAYNDDSGLDPAQLLVARRDVDKAMDLWHVFNTVQENVMRGGLEYRTRTNHAAQTRGFSNVPRTVDFNAALWQTAEDVAAELAA